ncbi:MAG: hypothetical protein LBL13_07395 [Bacteroidales bacterium]|jgi:hypothetical protein|nr:hypothetical protein [Bacteroidales bacterium]
MNDRQNAKITMYQTLYNTILEFAPVYKKVPAFAKAVEALLIKIQQLREVEKQQLNALSKGATQAKISVEDILITSLLKLCSSLYVYAFEINNQELVAKVNVNKSQLYRMEDNTLLVKANEILAKATEAATALEEYGVDAAEIADLAKCTADYEAVIVKPRTIIGEHKLHTTNLKQMFVETDSLVFDKLDKLINLFKVSDPDFYNSYKNARNIINLSPRKKKPETEENPETKEE